MRILIKTCPFVLCSLLADVENIPSEKYVIEAGKNITIPCPGVNEQSLVNTLIWKTNTVIARYTNGVPTSHNPRVSTYFTFPGGWGRLLVCGSLKYVVCLKYLARGKVVQQQPKWNGTWANWLDLTENNEQGDSNAYLKEALGICLDLRKPSS